MTDFGKVLYDATHALASSKHRYASAPWEERSGSRQDEYRTYAEAVISALIDQMLADLTAERIRYDQSPWWWRAEERVPDHASEGYVWTEETIAEALEDYLPGKPEEPTDAR